MTRHRVPLLCAFALAVNLGCKEQRLDLERASTEKSFEVVPAATIVRDWRYLGGCSGRDNAGLSAAWTPTIADASLIDARLRPLLDSLLAKQSDALRSRDYFLQYYGVYRDSAKFVVANGTSRQMNAETERLVREMGGQVVSESSVRLPCDAGRLYFRALFDLRGNLIDSLTFGSRL